MAIRFLLIYILILLVSGCSNRVHMNVDSVTEHNTRRSYTVALKILEHSNYQFYNYKIFLTKQEEDSLKKLNILYSKEYRQDKIKDFHVMRHQVAYFLSSLGNSYKISISIATLIEKYVRAVVYNHTNRSDFILRICTFNPKDNSELYKIPRWHFDIADTENQYYKNIITLKGPKTLFVHLQPGYMRKLKKIINNIDYTSSQSYMSARLQCHRIITACINDKNCIIDNAENGWATVFKIGNHESIALHSEPYIFSERLFVSIK